MRGYQRRALAWMVSREACVEAPDQEGSSSASSLSRGAAAHPPAVWNGTPHPSWQRVVLPSGLPFYHNWLTGTVLLTILSCIQRKHASPLCLQYVPSLWHTLPEQKQSDLRVLCRT